MVQINTLSAASLALFATSAAALPFHLPSWMKVARQSENESSAPQFPNLSPGPNEGVFPTQWPAPTGTQPAVLPTGTAFPTSLPLPTGVPSLDTTENNDIAKRDAHPQHKKRQDPWKPGVFVKQRDEQMVKRQGFALPTGTASSGLPAPTGGSWSSYDEPQQPQAKQFGGARHGGFKPHWGVQDPVYSAPTPTATAAPVPTGF
ncbi:hypothetical protein CKM354_001202600 [Cercospora kikuchii]|uniref:Uncharacterized protein n=1 Tax=Cercospora kikuchii TaxID=84275 RepID=A0A9P3CZC1_9PEZI|nr:uncharacterized protein CKM354_001202600 [Cercospora kikuchii]GIZ48985.1 hypothetical protein CKM354_001202600 [Cercospora kikuchii]